jgi:hypothetical protein
MKKSNLFFLCFIFLISCSTGTGNNFDLASNYLIDSIILNHVDKDNRILFQNNRDRVLIWYLSEMKNMLYYPKQIKFEINTEMFIDSNKNLYVLLHNSNCILKYKDSNLISKYCYGQEDKFSLYSFNFPLEIYGNQVLLDKIPNLKIYDPVERAKYFNSNLLAQFVLGNDSLVERTNFFKFPEIYQKNFYNEFYPVVCRISQDSIAYINSLTNELHVCNVNTGRGMMSALPMLRKNNKTPYDLDSLGDRNYDRRYDLRSTLLHKILYDRISKRFLIIQLLNIDNIKDSGAYMTIFSDKPVLINIIDSTFALIKTIYMPNQSNFMFFNSFYYNNKFYVPQSSKRKSNLIHIYEIY